MEHFAVAKVADFDNVLLRYEDALRLDFSVDDLDNKGVGLAYI